MWTRAGNDSAKGHTRSHRRGDSARGGVSRQRRVSSPQQRQEGGRPGNAPAGRGTSPASARGLRAPVRSPYRRRPRARPPGASAAQASLRGAGHRQSARRLEAACAAGTWRGPRAGADPARTREPRAPPAVPRRSPTPESEQRLGPAAAAAARSSTRKCTEPASGTLQPRLLAGTTEMRRGSAALSGGRRRSPRSGVWRRWEHCFFMDENPADQCPKGLCGVVTPRRCAVPGLPPARSWCSPTLRPPPRANGSALRAHLGHAPSPARPRPRGRGPAPERSRPVDCPGNPSREY